MPMKGRCTTEPLGEIANISPPPLVANPKKPGAYLGTSYSWLYVASSLSGQNSQR